MKTIDQLLALENAAALITQAASQFIVRPTGGLISNGISGFLFDIMGREEVNIESDITDHYVEDNVAIQDHIALRPERFTLMGYAGELTDAQPRALTALLGATKSLALVPGFSPEFVTQATQVYDAIQTAFQNSKNVIQQAQSLYQLFNQKGTAATKQQQAFNYFYAMWITRQLCTVETPYQIFEFMAIDTIRAVQNEDTKMVTDFSITFKKIRIASTVTTPNTLESAGRAANLYALTAQKGKSVGQPANQSELNIAFGPSL